MAIRTNEMSTCIGTVKGTRLNDKGEEKRNYYTVDPNSFSTALHNFHQQGTGNHQLVLEIPPSISTIYQKVCIDTTDVYHSRGTNYYHFSGKFIFRDQENINTIDTDSLETEVIELDGSKFVYIQLHFTVIPSTASIIADSKCYNKNLEFILKNILSVHLDPAPYQIDQSSEFLDCLNIKVKGDARKDYETVLRQNFNKLQSVGLTFGRPSRYADEIQAQVDPDQQFIDMFGQMIGSLVGVNYDAENSPFIGIKIELKINETPRGMSEVFTGYKRNIKNKLLSLQDNKYLKEGRVEYLDDNDELQHAIRRGVTKSSKVQVAISNYSNDNQMWREQCRAYQELHEME